MPREERAPRPEREHPIGKAMYDMSTVLKLYISANTEKGKASCKEMLTDRVAELTALIQAL